MRTWRTLLAAAWVAGAVWGQDAPKADTPEQAADKVLAAVAAKDDAALKALAERDDPDPWLVADELCRRGEAEAVRAFVQLVPGVDADGLAAYVKGVDVAAGVTDRAGLDRALESLVANDARAALDALAGVAAPRDDVLSVRVLAGRARALQELGLLEESSRASREAAEKALRMGWIREAASAFDRAGSSAFGAADFETAARCWEHALELEERRGDRSGVIRATGHLGAVHERLGQYEEATARYARTLELSRLHGDLFNEGAALTNLGNVHLSLRDFPRAFDCHRKALAIMEKLEDRVGIPYSLGNLGLVCAKVGDLGEALEYQSRALALMEKIDDRAGVARTLLSLGDIDDKRGSIGEALSRYERALRIMEEQRDRAGIANALNRIGNMQYSLGQTAIAIEYQKRALEIWTSVRYTPGIAATLGNLGLAEAALGNDDEALRHYDQVMTLMERLGDRAGQAATLSNMAKLQRRRGRTEQAIDLLGAAVRISESIGDRIHAARTLLELARIEGSRGSFENLSRYAERAASYAEGTGSVQLEIDVLRERANVLLQRHEYGEVLRLCRLAVAKLPLMVQGLADEERLHLREREISIFDIAIDAAATHGNAEDLTFFIEQGRATELLHAMGGRSALGEAVLPEELRDGERSARRDVLAAAAASRRARAGGERAAIDESRARLERANDHLLAVVRRIQREARAAADLAYPSVESLSALRSGLASDEALVYYALVTRDAFALVVTPDSTRIVRLSGAAALRDACEALAPDARAEAWSAALATLRDEIIEPLGLGEGTRRLFISPSDRLAYVPLALVAGDCEVAYVPSGTVCRLLRADAPRRGTGVLAIGDPEYRGGPGAASPHGLSLVPLPGTREEARTVGDTVLLGKQATESSFWTTLERERRWRAIHLACHARVDAERPQLSSLVLAPEATADGLLSVLDVFRRRIPADLVVLSACETGKGRIYRSEGIVGLTRAFMFAGAPRVIVSLWKVDDEATRALMVKFYELWNPKDGSKGLPTANALKKAMEFVRDHPDHPEWKHPKYWAAWQLWGLPD